MTKSKAKEKIKKEKSHKQYLIDNDIDREIPDKDGRVKDPMDGKDYAEYKMPRRTKKTAIEEGWTEDSGVDWKDW